MTPGYIGIYTDDNGRPGELIYECEDTPEALERVCQHLIPGRRHWKVTMHAVSFTVPEKKR